jgi:hypothetical protein
MLLGDGGLLLCSGGVFFGIRSGGNDIFNIILLLLCSGGVFFGVRSGSITWQRHLYKIEPFLWGLLLGNDNRQVVFSLGSEFQKCIIFGGAEIAQQRPAESMAGETSSRPTNLVSTYLCKCGDSYRRC